MKHFHIYSPVREEISVGIEGEMCTNDILLCVCSLSRLQKNVYLVHNCIIFLRFSHDEKVVIFRIFFTVKKKMYKNYAFIKHEIITFK